MNKRARYILTLFATATLGTGGLLALTPATRAGETGHVLLAQTSMGTGMGTSMSSGMGSASGTAAASGDGLHLLMPVMNAAKGRILFASKGCVVCHSINGVGGTDAPKLDAASMPGYMNPFDFAARMWHGAPAMIAMQQHELGHQIQFTGDELADIVAFAHDAAEQAKFSKKDIPPDITKMMMEGD